MVTIADRTNAPWSLVGKNIGETNSMREAMIKGGLDYEVVKEPLYRSDGSIIPKYYGIMRKDTREIFDTVKEVWKGLSNQDAFEFFDPALQKNLIKIESVGSLRGGKRAFIVARINETPLEITKGDIVNKYMLLLNNFDKTSIRVGFIPVRFSCTNQLASIMRDRQSQILKIRHCRSPKVALEQLRGILDLANAEFTTTQEKLKMLASTSINSQDLQKYIKIALEIKEDKDGNISTRSSNIINQIANLAVSGGGNDNPNVRGTYYAAYNGITEYLNYYAGRNVDTRLENLWLGKNANINNNALSVALDMAS